MRALGAAIVALLAGPALAGTPLDRARAAVAAAPDRPGLRLVLADLLFEAGDLAAAEAEARRVLAEWPASHRARVLLARIDAARGDVGAARAALSDVAATAPAPIAADALRLLDRPVPSAWRFGARLGYDYDSVVERACLSIPEWNEPARCRESSGRRVSLGADLGYERELWAIRAGVDRTTVLDSQDDDRVVEETTQAWLELRGEHPVGSVRLGGRVEGRAFTGYEHSSSDGERDGRGVGAGVWARGADPTLSPWLLLRGLYVDAPPVLSHAEATSDGELQTEAATGLRFAGGRLEGGLRLSFVWVPDAFHEYGADVDGGLDLAPVRLFARAGAGRRVFADEFSYWDDGLHEYEDLTGGAELRLRAGGGVALALVDGLSIVAEALWQGAGGDDPLRDRLIAGLRLEFRR